MVNKILISKNKILKLTNVIKKKIEVDEFASIDKEVSLMDNYIKSKGAIPVGPLIQHTDIIETQDGKIEMSIILMRQSNNFINNIDDSYRMKSMVRVKNCFYTRFIGKEEDIHFAYDKMNVMAYEENIKLKGDNYTIFVDKQDENIVVDIFMECMDDD
ncbi:MAG: hypothetical protein SOY42_07315 [Clostridium sp.]|nr:hypothetical protein [Clostridium sp.]